MANFDQLKQSVAALIRTNGAEEITGQIMQDVLLTIINSISGGYMFGGVAQHSGNVGNPDYNVFYLAGSGAYTGYGDAINIPNGCYGVFRYNGSWTQDVVDIGVHLTGTIREGETNGVTGDVINTALQQLFNNIMNILDTLTFTYNTPSAQQATKAMLDVIVTPTGGASHVLTTLTLVSATAAAAGLMSAEDKRKVDRMLTDFRSLSFSDTTAVADQATKIVQTLSATLGENPEAITTMTFLAATASKAGLLSAADKAKLDAILGNLRSLEIDDTTAYADLGDKIVESIKATIGGTEETISTFQILAATASKAGLLSAADKAKLDALWSSGYQFAGIATPSTTPISTTSKIFYIATEAGTYFNAVTVTQGINILSRDGTSWSAVQVIGIDDEPDFLSSNLVESKGVKTLDYKIKNIIVDTTNTHTDAQIALDRAFIESIKKFVVYNPNKSNDTVFLRLFGYYTGTTNEIQLTITYDKSTFVDLTIPATSKPTGLQEHVFEKNGIQAMLIFDWDLFGEYDEYNSQRYAISTVDTQDIPDFATLRPIEKLQNINLSNSSFETGLDEIPSTNTGKYLLDCIKNIKFFDGNGDVGDKYYLRVFGIFDSTFSPSVTTPYIQFSAWDGTNSESVVDFRKTYDSSEDTGLKTYTLSSDCARLELSVDWDLYTSYFHSTSNPISFENKYFDENDTTASMALCGHLLNAPAYSKRFPNGISCPVKVASYDCQVVTMRIESKLTGKLSIYVGSYDQNLLFIPREEHQIDVVEGTQEIDLSERNIFLIKGETIAADTSFLGWAQGAVGSAGDDSDSYYYTNRSASMWQLECHPLRAVYGSFYYDVLTSKTVRALAKTSFLERENDILKEELDKVETIASNANIVTDSSGNKYKLKVVNGDVVPVALTIRNVIVVGNSITIHPTYTDTEPDYHTNIWWGHWSMAATCKDVSWPKLLENILKERNAESSVTPVFGRRYELTNATPTTPDTFTYWDESQWKDFGANIGNFSNTDCIIFYLGHNYSGDDWETKYQAMIDQFKTWFPSAWMVCVAAYSSKTAVNNAIYNVATKEGFEYITPITMVKNKVGAYVSSDGGTLHQIGNSAVAGHPGDYGEYVILDRMCRTSTLSLTNNTPLYSVNLESEEDITLSTVTNQVLYKSIVSVFVTVSNNAEFEGLVVEDDGGNTISVTDQGNTAYGRVFTFEMPADNVTVSVS